MQGVKGGLFWRIVCVSARWRENLLGLLVHVADKHQGGRLRHLAKPVARYVVEWD